MRARDSRDRRYPERLTVSYVISVIGHVLAALLLFSIASSSSQEGASQSIRGGEIVTLEHRAVAQAQPAPAPTAVPPIPHAPVIAPIPKHAPAPQTAAQRQPRNLHELAKQTPNATPNPKPVPQSSKAPNPQPTDPVYEPKPEQGIPAVPISVPTAQVVAVTIKIPPTTAPSPAPSAAPTTAPTAKPQPSTAPTRAPATPAPTSTAAAIKPAAIARQTAAPSSPAPPGPLASVAPAKTAGVPSPGPTTGPAQANSQGTSPTPGPKGTGAPGPHAGASANSHPGPAAPITVTPTSAPSSSGNGSHGTNALSNKLRGLLLPSGQGTPPKQAHIAPGFGAISTQMVPTPPPDVVARTQFIFSSDPATEGLRIFHIPISIGPPMAERVEMWVTSSEKRGPVTICHGWLVRFPTPVRGSRALAPIVEPDATFICNGRDLTPYKH